MKKLTDLELFATRLRTARIMRQWSMDDLLYAMPGVKLSKPAISKYENAKMMPSADIRAALAKALGVDESYFSRPLVCTSDTAEISFRKKSSMRVAEVKSLTAKVQDKVERYLEILAILSDAQAYPPIPMLPGRNGVTTHKEAADFAREVRRMWRLSDDYPIGNVQSELERRGIIVIPIEADDDFDGLSGKVDKDKVFIAINANPNKSHTERRRLTVMHELAHQLMTFGPNVTPREEETLCNVFANEMLITTPVFKALLQDEPHIDLLSLRPIQCAYGISIDALMKKAEETGLINRWDYTSFNIVKNKNQNYKQAVEQSLYRESPIYDRFVSLVLKALSLKLIDRDKAKALLYDLPDDAKADLLVI